MSADAKWPGSVKETDSRLAAMGSRGYTTMSKPRSAAVHGPSHGARYHSPKRFSSDSASVPCVCLRVSAIRPSLPTSVLSSHRVPRLDLGRGCFHEAAAESQQLFLQPRAA